MKNYIKYTIGLGVATALLSGVFILVSAQNGNSEHPSMMSGHPPMMININSAGRALLRGTVKAVGADSLTVTSWGGDWTVGVSSDTKVLPSSDLTKIKVGDFVGAKGKANQAAIWTIDASMVRDWTSLNMEMENKKEVQKEMKKARPKIFEGTVSNLNSSNNSFALTVEGTAFSVNLGNSTKIVNKKFTTISFGDIKSNDEVRVFGTVSGDNTINDPVVVRDVSL